MPLDPIDRLAGRIAQELRAGRRARHPRARIAHFMLADAYRAMVRRMLRAGTRAEPSAPVVTRYEPSIAQAGFLADRQA